MADKELKGRVYSPELDIADKKEAFVVWADFPGASPESVEINLENDLITVRGVAAEIDVGGLPLIYQEFEPGDYETTLKLSTAIDRDKVEAELKDGVLALTLPKAPEAKPKAIKIKAR